MHTIKLQDRQPLDARDALAKAVYGQLFNHIVANINASINCSRKDVRGCGLSYFTLSTLLYIQMYDAC